MVSGVRPAPLVRQVWKTENTFHIQLPMPPAHASFHTAIHIPILGIQYLTDSKLLQRSTMRFLAGVVFFVPTILALAFDAPEATSVTNNLNLDPQSWSPRPTEAPEFKELVRRQASGTSTLVEAPDSLCGYKFGISSKFRPLNAPLLPLTAVLGSGFGLCGTTARCGFATTPLGYGSVYCFSSTVTEARTWTSCNGGNAASSCLLDSLCKSNPLVVIWYVIQSFCHPYLY